MKSFLRRQCQWLKEKKRNLKEIHQNYCEQVSEKYFEQNSFFLEIQGFLFMINLVHL